MTSDCIPIPHADQLRSIHLDYNGHGTTLNDVIISVGIPFVIGLALVLAMLVYWWHNSRRRLG